MSNRQSPRAEDLPPREWFDRWWDPPEFFEGVNRHSQGISPVDFFGKAELKPLREAYAAGLFSLILGQQDLPVAVRLDGDRFPDFNLRIGDELCLFEIVEAYPPGQKRGDEYKEAARRKAEGLPEVMEEFDPQEEERAAIPVIVEAVRKKAEKNYQPPPCLLVYVNFWLFREPVLSPREFAERLNPWGEKFQQTWLLWGANAIRCRPDPVRFFAHSLPSWLVP